MIDIGVLRDLGGGRVENVSGHEVEVGVERGDGVGVREEGFSVLVGICDVNNFGSDFRRMRRNRLRDGI